MEDKQFDKNIENEKGETKVSPLSLHNIYQNIHISLKTLDTIIVVLVIALVIAILIGLNRRGFVIEFDSMGGSYVEPQKHMYGEKIEYIVPQRDGYTFEGWSTSQSCLDMWNEDAEIVDSMKLYACWIE